MYTFSLQNQENSQKRLNLRPVHHSNDYFNKKKGAKSALIISYRGVGKKIYDFIYSLRNFYRVQLKNETIALKVGCSVRTVQRWTNRMVKDGLLIKAQFNSFAVNEFSLNLTKREEYEYHLNTLSDKHREEKMYHGTIDGNDKSSTFLFETVIQSYSYINKYIYITNRYPSPYTRDAHARERCDFLQKQKSRVAKGLMMLPADQREWISKHKNEPKMCDVLQRDEMKSQIITPSIEKVAQLLDLSARERLKLTAFPDEIMDELCDYVVRCMDGKVRVSKQINDRVGWLLGIANNLCARKQVKPEWQWYYALCDILKIVPLDMVITKRPLILPVYVGKAAVSPKKQAAKSIGGDFRPPMYQKYEGEKEKTPAEKREFIIKEIANRKDQLANPDKYFFFGKESCIKYAIIELDQLESDLKSLHFQDPDNERTLQ